MGMFDTVFMHCPYCRASIEEQTKAGPCELSAYSLTDAPDEVLRDIAGEHTCGECGRTFKIALETTVKATYVTWPK